MNKMSYGVLLVLFLLFFGYFFLSQSNSEDIKSSNIDSIEWLTYRHEEIGFEIQYPADYHLETTSGEDEFSLFNVVIDEEKTSDVLSSLIGLSVKTSDFTLGTRDWHDIMIGNIKASSTCANSEYQIEYCEIVFDRSVDYSQPIVYVIVRYNPEYHELTSEILSTYKVFEPNGELGYLSASCAIASYSELLTRGADKQKMLKTFSNCGVSFETDQEPQEGTTKDVLVEDLNSDGDQDLLILDFISARGPIYQGWLYNNQDDQYIKSVIYTGDDTIDADNRLFIRRSYNGCGAGCWLTTVYEWDGYEVKQIESTEERLQEDRR